MSQKSDINIKIDFEEEMLKAARLLMLRSNNMRIDYVGIIKGFDHLECKVDKLPLFNIPDYLPEDKKNELKLYILKEFQYGINHMTDFFRYMNAWAPYATENQNNENETIFQKFSNEIFNGISKKICF